MELKLQIKTEGKRPNEKTLNVSDTVLINFSRNLDDNAYIISFVNDNNYTTLSYEFLSNQIIDCYFAYHKKNGKTIYAGYTHVTEREVDISECTSFSIIIPRDKNHDVCTALTLVSLFAE